MKRLESESKKERDKRHGIGSVQLSKRISGGKKDKAFNSTEARGMSHVRAKATSPGPGQYDTRFKEDLQMLDHKLSSRYKATAF